MSNKAFIKHVVSLYENFNDLPLDINIDGRTFTVTLKGQGCEFYLYPKFLISNSNFTCYTHRVNSDIVAFSGWQNYRRLPYPELQQKILANKIQTKKELELLGIKMPAWSIQRDNDLSPVIIKKRVSSFAADIHGPFIKSADYLVDSNDQFYEQFIKGNIIKIWFWKKSPVILESQPMPSIIGNGSQTVDQLIRTRAGYDQNFLYENRIDEVLAFYNKKRRAVLDEGEELMVDFRYGSMLAEPLAIDEFYFPLKEYPVIQDQISHLADSLWKFLKADPDKDFIYTVDAILSDDDELYILEINTNPEVHPYLYRYMAESISKLLPKPITII